MTAKALRSLAWVAGGALTLLGLFRILFPIQTIPGAVSLTASLDTETRAGGVLLIAFGAAYLWVAGQSSVPAVLLRLLAATMALLALSRIISIVESGLPHWIFVLSAAVEVVAAVLTWWYSTLPGHAQVSGQCRRQKATTKGEA